MGANAPTPLSPDATVAVAAANDALAQAQQAAFWDDLVADARGDGGPRGAVRVLKAARRQVLGRGQPRRGAGGPELRRIEPVSGVHEYADWAAVRAGDRAPLVPVAAGTADRDPLHVAFLIPPFGFGSGGHEVVVRAVDQLERGGDTCSIWLDDPFGKARGPASGLRRQLIDAFGVGFKAPVHVGLDDWAGAHVAVATGSQTVWPLMRLAGCGARAYLVNDDETSFYPASIESTMAEQTYAEDLYLIAGTEWMLDRIRDRHPATGGHFDYPVSDVYFPRAVPRRTDTVVVYARMTTPRRAVPLAVLALEELILRRGRDLRVVMFGNDYPPPARFPYEFTGLTRPEQLAHLYSEGTVGIALSMTNASLVPQDMAACGLPSVELEEGAAASVYGTDGPVELTPFDVQGLADAVERLLDDDALRARRADAGLRLAGRKTWAAAGDSLRREIRTALREREVPVRPLPATAPVPVPA